MGSFDSFELEYMKDHLTHELNFDNGKEWRGLGKSGFGNDRRDDGTLACNRDIEQYKGNFSGYGSKTGTQPIKTLAHSALHSALRENKMHKFNRISFHLPPARGWLCACAVAARVARVAQMSLVEAAAFRGFGCQWLMSKWVIAPFHSPPRA